MDQRIAYRKFLPVFLMVFSEFAMAATWYADGIHGRDNNNCKSPQNACKTIGHAISLASSGDSVIVAASTYAENLGGKAGGLKVVPNGPAHPGEWHVLALRL